MNQEMKNINFKILQLGTRGTVTFVVSNGQFYQKECEDDDLSFNVRWVSWQSLYITGSPGRKRR